jgi:IMP dehydrogenase
LKVRRVLSFDDVLIVPKYSDIESRKLIDTSVSHSCFNAPLKMPIVSAPMDSITESAMASTIDAIGGLGIIHRYNSIEEQESLVHRCYVGGANNIGAAIGVTGDYRERAHALIKAGANVICVDVAHGHHKLMKRCLESLRRDFGDSVHIMAGNVATLEGFNDLSDWGSDSIRVGIGGGSICSTRLQTGHGVPTLQSVIDCSRSDRDTLLIADGGIKNSGDMVKALAAGADLLMCGSLLSGTDETPGEIIQTVGGQKKKVYRGMASREAQKSWRNAVGSIEGIATTVVAKGPVANVLLDLSWGIKSGLSYSGASDLSQFRAVATLVEQSPAGAKESNTHILSVN